MTVEEKKDGEIEKKGEEDILTQDVVAATGIHTEISSPETNHSQNVFKTPQNDIHTADFCKSLTEDMQNMGTEPLVCTPSRLHTVTTLRNSVGNMESDFISFKMEMTQTTQSLQSEMVTLANETKDRLTQFDNNLKLRIKNIEEENKELIASNEKLVGEVSSLSSTVKKLQEQVNSMRKRNSILEEQHQILKEDHEATKTELESLQKCQLTQCHNTAQQFPEESPEITPPTSTEPIIITSTHVPLANRFEVLQDDQEKLDLQVSEMDHTQNVDTQQNKNNIHQTKPETATNGYNQQQTTPNLQRNLKPDIVILCDSNGKYLKLKKLCPNKKAMYQRCPTIKRGNDIITSLTIDSPETILIHTGTNDLEQSSSPVHLASEISNLITATARKYPSTKILYSTLLPRQDVPSEDILKINTWIEKRCSRIANVHLIDHSNLHLSQSTVLHDSKHLNQTGIKVFAKNLKSMIYGRRSTISFHQTDVQRTNSFPNNRPQRVNMTHVTPRTQAYTQTPVPTYAAVVQGPPPLAAERPSSLTAVQRPPPLAAIQQTPAFAMEPPQPLPGIQQQMDQQGKTLNMSIPTKLLPLIQLLTNLV